MNKILIAGAAFMLGCGLSLSAKTTIHNGTPYPIKVKITTTAGLKNPVVEDIEPLAEIELMKGAAAGVCITKYQVWVKESGMNDYAVEPNLQVGKLSDCGFRKHLMVTATKDKETGNFVYYLSHAAMAPGKLGVHIHNSTASKILVEINGAGIRNAKFELEPGELKTVLSGGKSGFVVNDYKIWVLPFGADKYNEKPDGEIKGYWSGFNKQLFVLQNTALDGSLTYKFKAEAYA